MKVYTVSVFESGDMTTKVWGVFDTLEKAEKYKDELNNDIELNDGDYYLTVGIAEHEVR